MLTPQKTNMSPQNMIVGRLFSFWNGPFFRGTCVHFRVGCHQILIPKCFNSRSSTMLEVWWSLQIFGTQGVFVGAFVEGFGMGGLVCVAHILFGGFLGVPFSWEKVGGNTPTWVDDDDVVSFPLQKRCGGVGCKDDYLAPLERVLYVGP